MPLQARRPPPPLTLTDDLTTSPPKKRDLVDGLLAVDSNVLLTAERKTGKTTLLLNLAGALLAGRDFLGRPTRLPTDRSVVFLNLEVGRGQFARWAARSVRSDAHDRFVSQPLRGSPLPLTDHQVRQQLAEKIRPFEPGVLIVDPWGALIAGWAAENSNDEVAAALLALEHQLEFDPIAGWATPTGEEERGTHKATNSKPRSSRSSPRNPGCTEHRSRPELVAGDGTRRRPSIASSNNGRFWWPRRNHPSLLPTERAAEVDAAPGVRRPGQTCLRSRVAVSPLPGLDAVGNVSDCMNGPAFSGGDTLSMGMSAAYIAGNHAPRTSTPFPI